MVEGLTVMGAAFVRGSVVVSSWRSTAAVVDRAVGGFNHPSSRLDDQPAAGFRPGHHVYGDTGTGCGPATVCPLLALADPDVADRARDPFRLAQELEQYGTVLQSDG